MNIKNLIMTAAMVAAMAVPACAADIPQGACPTTNDGLWHMDNCNAHRYVATDEEWQMIINKDDTKTANDTAIYGITPKANAVNGVFTVYICDLDENRLAMADYDANTGVVSNVVLLVTPEEFLAAEQYKMVFCTNTSAGVMMVKMTSSTATIETDMYNACSVILDDMGRNMTLENSTLYYNPETTQIKCVLNTDAVEVSITSAPQPAMAKLVLEAAPEIANKNEWFELGQDELNLMKENGLTPPVATQMAVEDTVTPAFVDTSMFNIMWDKIKNFDCIIDMGIYGYDANGYQIVWYTDDDGSWHCYYVDTDEEALPEPVVQ